MNNLKKSLNERIIKLNKENIENKNNKINNNEQNLNNPYNNLPDDFIFTLFQMNINKSHIIIYDDEYEIDNPNNKYKKILDMNLINFFIKMTISNKIFNLSFNLEDMSITQEIVKSNDYDILLISKPIKDTKNKIENKKTPKILIFEFEINKSANYTYKIIMKNERKIIYVLNFFILQYIQYKILGAIYTSISFVDLSNYAKGDINKYLRIGYLINEEKYKKNKKIKSYYNYCCKIDIISPLIIMPQNILDKYNNKCLIIYLGDISLESNLVSSIVRKYIVNSPEKNDNNEINKNENIDSNSFSLSSIDSNNSDDLYDNYNLSIKGFKALLSNECLKENLFISKDASSIINKTDISIIYKTLIIPEDKNLNTTYLNISINKIELNLDEFQILLLIVLSKQMRTQSLMLYQIQQKRELELNNNNNLNRLSTNFVKNFKEQLIEKGILEKEDEKNDELNIINEIKSYEKEEDFIYKKNEYFYEVNINKIKFSIYKRYPDLSKHVFLETEIDLFYYLMCGNVIKDSLMKLTMKNLKLYDKEKNINKQYIVIKEYQTLIKNNSKFLKSNEENLFSYSNIYINNLKENKSEIKFCNIDILITFDSLKRIYTFSMYYYKIFYENYLNVYSNTNKKKDKNLDSDNKLKNVTTILKYNPTLIPEQHTKEIIKNKFIFQIKIIDNYIVLPYSPNSLDSPSLSLKLNMFYDQSSDSETMNIYNKQKKLIQTVISPNNSYINLMIYESNFDLIEYNKDKKEFIFNKRINKIISNYRIQFTYKYSNLTIDNQSLSDINILIEPIIIDICLDQFKDILLFYYQSMKFLYEDLYEYYIPYIKPENVVYIHGKECIKKRKLTFKKLSYRVFILIKIRKSFNNKNQKKSKKEKQFNSVSSININMDKSTITIFDNDLNGKRLLLEIKIDKMLFKLLNNSNPKNNKQNVFNELLSILAAYIVPFEKYVVHNLYKYMDISFIFSFNYYNLEYSSFEPIIEPLPFQYLSYQVDRIFKHKTIIKSDNILNFNISSNCIKVLNLFLCKYYSEEKEKNIRRGSVFMLKDLNYMKKEKFEENDKILYRIINKTGLPVLFWFNFKSEEKYTLNNKEYLNFSYKTLYKNRREQIKIQQKYPEQNTFSFQILGFEIIQNINLNKNNILYFKTKIIDNKYLFYNVFIDTSGLVYKIKFNSSIVFYNRTIFDGLIMSIDDKLIKDNYILLQKNKKIKIPLNWMLSDKKIYLQLKKGKEKHILYNNISECIFCQKLNEEELENIQNEKKKYKEKLTESLNNNKEINLQHPKYKDYISTSIGQNFNIQKNYQITKRFTIIDEKQIGKSYSFNLNYLALSYNEKRNSYSSEIYKNLKKTEKSYRYLIIISPIISIINYIPFNIICKEKQNKTNKEENIIKISPLKTKEIYDVNWIINKNHLIKVSIKYDNNIYNSIFFNLFQDNNEKILNKVILRDKDSNCLIVSLLVKKDFEESESIFEVVEQFSISSIHLIFFFEYIVNNRMEFNLFGKGPLIDNNMKNNNNICLFKKKKNSLLSSIKDLYKINISDNNSEFDDKNQFILKSIGLNKNIEIVNDKKIYNISCTILNSVDFIYSNIIMFEPKYILINNLDFDVYCVQVTKERNKILKLIKKNEKIMLSYIKSGDKKLFKLGMKIGNQYSWSGEFNIDDSKDYDYKIAITKEIMKKYKKYSYTTGNKNYLFFRIKFRIYQYTTYILITFSEFPDLEIQNRTSEVIKIFEDIKEPPIIVEPREDIPFIWKNVTDIKKELICQIGGKNHYFTYLSFNENKIQFNKKKYINIGVRRNKTGSRVLILEEKGYGQKFREYFMIKQQKSLSTMKIELKGIGISFLDETPKEIFFISFYELKIIYRTTKLLNNREYIEQINFCLKNFQIDYCLNDSLKSLIHPKKQRIPSLEEQNKEDNDEDFIMIFIDRTSYHNEENKILYMNYNNIGFLIKEMNVKINQIILMNLINLIQGYTALFDYSQKIKKKNNMYIIEDNLIENNDKFIDNLIKENRDSNKILINYLFLSSLKIYITFRIDLSNIEISFLPDIISNAIISLGSSLIRITDTPLSFSSIVIKDIYMDTNIIISLLIKEFTTEGIFQIYKLLGNTDLIGSPLNLLDKIGNGFFELVNEPTKGLMQGPTQLGLGLAKGVTGLLNGVVGGTMDSVSKITGTLYTTVHGILGKKEALIMNNEDDEPENLLVGATQGIEGGYQELKEGVTGFFINPFERAKQSGAVGFIKGLSTGIFGLAISPFTFALKLGGSLAAGTKNTFGTLYNKSLKNKRFRFPRYIEQSKPLQNYDADLSAAKEFLAKLIQVENPLILYFSSFFCNNEGYKNRLAFLIVTNEFFLILSDNNKILLNIKINEVKDVKLCYIKDNFNIIFELKNKKTKILIIDKSCVVMACHFYDNLKAQINSLNEKNY